MMRLEEEIRFVVVAAAKLCFPTYYDITLTCILFQSEYQRGEVELKGCFHRVICMYIHLSI